MRNTTTIVSADHGESFEGGIYQHETQYMTRPVIHIPLIIRTPQQQQGRVVEYVADQTALAPTILDLAGVPKPASMQGESLDKWLKKGGAGEAEGLAFSQFFEINSVFEPLRHGTVGVVDGKYQYLVILNSQRGVLRPLREAHRWNIDRTSDDPARAAALSAAIYAKFPEIIQNNGT
jgi:arylsulfatase A-like enzyme